MPIAPARRANPRRFLLLIFILLVFGLVFFALPSLVESHFNRVLSLPPYNASSQAQALHRSLLIADLHADSLLWGRNLLKESRRGHVDVPRLVKGNVALQVFSLPTKTPWGLNIERNRADSDQITWLAIAEDWPVSTWSSLTERALYQAKRLQRMAETSNGGFVVIRTSADLDQYLARRNANPQLTAGLLSIEGAHALGGNLANIDVLYNAGYRMMAPSHFFDNDIGGSSAGVAKSGLTEKGRSMIRSMEEKHMIVDLAHASWPTFDDALNIATRPVVVSHTGVKATCNNNRNLSDSQIRRVGANGGLVGVGYWETATCGNDAKAIVRSMRHVADLIGVEHVALGSDFDGAVVQPFDTTGLITITDELIAEGFSEDQIRLIMGVNVFRFFRANLP